MVEPSFEKEFEKSGCWWNLSNYYKTYLQISFPLYLHLLSCLLLNSVRFGKSFINPIHPHLDVLFKLISLPSQVLCFFLE